MTKNPELESEATRQGRTELLAIVDELRAIKVRVLALARRLKRAARTGEVLGTIVNDELTLTLYPNGKPYTAEDWFADSLKAEIAGSEGHLSESIRALAGIASEDSREWARIHIRSMNGEDATATTTEGRSQ